MPRRTLRPTDVRVIRGKVVALPQWALAARDARRMIAAVNRKLEAYDAKVAAAQRDLAQLVKEGVPVATALVADLEARGVDILKPRPPSPPHKSSFLRFLRLHQHEFPRFLCRACNCWAIRWARARSRYCSDACYREAQNKRRPSRAKPRERHVCSVCRKPFDATRSDARFCSGRCRVAAHRRVRNGPA